MTAVDAPGLVRRRVRVEGVVQGVGFRPFVYRVATELGLAGHVGNDPDGVFIEVEGRAPAVEALSGRLLAGPPPLAHIERLCSTPIPFTGERGFRVVPSRSQGPGATFVSPDMAVCADCLGELFDPHDRRYRYPFVNCTNCGPRFTITVRLPYDRPHTTMARFPLCEACAAEYQDPADRRFHAEPVACPSCGPRLWFEAGGREQASGDDALAATLEALSAGGVVAIKGIGGYHLACDAASDDAVAELRRRKHRQAKPLALMVGDLGAARRLAVVNEAEAQLLTSPERPIVLVRRRPRARLSQLVAPHNPRLGIMLPYSPLHHLLFAPVPGRPVAGPGALVMTSGNVSEEPICHRDDDARRRLRSLADAWLLHDRPIHVPCDDSVVRVVDGDEMPVRRSRGYAPLPVRLPFASPPLQATGGELKNTFCLAAGRHAWLSQHIGDMGSLATLGAFEHTSRHLAELYDVVPARLAADLHPGYQTRRWAEACADERGVEVDLVQHHHAHVAAAMVEHRLPPDARVLGFAFDGTGFGTEGAVWGGEVLHAGYAAAERVAHLREVPLPGGDAAVRKPYRMALTHLFSAGIDWSADLPPAGAGAPGELAALRRQLETGLGCVPTSSMGRLFDAVSSLLGICQVASYEAQAAIELEAVAEGQAASVSAGKGRAGGSAYRFAQSGEDIDPAPVLAAVVDDIRGGRPAELIAARFHLAVAQMMGDVVARFRRGRRVDAVMLTGGVFQNAVLVRMARDQLKGDVFPVLTHRVVPPNDGGLALGQAAVSACRSMERGA